MTMATWDQFWCNLNPSFSHLEDARLRKSCRVAPPQEQQNHCSTGGLRCPCKGPAPCPTSGRGGGGNTSQIHLVSKQELFPKKEMSLFFVWVFGGIARKPAGELFKVVFAEFCEGFNMSEQWVGILPTKTVVLLCFVLKHQEGVHPNSHTLGIALPFLRVVAKGS